MSWTGTTVEAVQGEVTSGFFELGVAEPLVRVLAGQGITNPSRSRPPPSVTPSRAVTCSAADAPARARRSRSVSRC
ncbi:hypothetical protein [Tessaracoccus coleopterorum]|uniref:hypothetical protein n=1 Tax=Tessaracoccus coleopterorum TaxID=2714950 RepID=UPI0038CD811D